MHTTNQVDGKGVFLLTALKSQDRNIFYTARVTQTHMAKNERNNSHPLVGEDESKDAA
ncbi:unnamed protein product, partial [Candidula unifasciata]